MDRHPGTRGGVLRLPESRRGRAHRGGRRVLRGAGAWREGALPRPAPAGPRNGLLGGRAPLRAGGRVRTGAEAFGEPGKGQVERETRGVAQRAGLRGFAWDLSLIHISEPTRL